MVQGAPLRYCSTYSTTYEYLILILQTAGETEAVVGTVRQQPIPAQPINRPARSKADVHRRLALHYAALGKFYGRLSTIMAKKNEKSGEGGRRRGRGRGREEKNQDG